ncbi:MAG: 16S rRNA (guanine(527)-N(7))-methyltransferase RsmG [Oscillospiraceae bacterium]|nr:16S rRNA (guanine(527)-N(7))-methyltransferase RsmG [Oscillospiraceae bacterium]
MSIDKEKLISLAEAAGVALTPQMAEQFDRYAGLLVEWNEKMNLTAITQPEEIVVKHFVDSLIPLAQFPVPQNASVIDVGTGAGFPGLPWKIARPDLKLTLLDSLNKRLNFLNEVLSQLQITGETVHARAEDGGKNPQYRERFDIATARAVANLTALSEYCLPYVNVGGYFLALKSGQIDDELEQAKPAIRLLGGKCREIIPYALPDGSGRSLIVLEKISQTPAKYPRPAAQMAKKPL